MPNIQSAKKRVKVSEKKNLHNRIVKSQLHTSVKKFEAALEADAKTANEQILDSLPDEFTKKDLAEKKPGAKDSTLRGLLKSWIDSGKLLKTGKVYKKVS